MNAEPVQTGLLLAAIAAACTVALLVRGCHSAARVPRAERFLPSWVRWLWVPAEPFIGFCRWACPARMLVAANRRLGGAGLDPPLRAPRWFAMRLVIALVVGALLGVLSTPSGVGSMLLVVLSAVGASFMPETWLATELRRREQRINRELPAYLDLLTVSVEAGAALTAGVRLIVECSPEGPLRSYFERVLREIRGGRTRAQAFAFVADIHAVPALSSLATALAHGESSGMSLGAVLRAQSAQRTAERFATAEKLAMQAPVKLLGPLILCIFPCTFVVLAVPIVFRLKEAFAS